MESGGGAKHTTAPLRRQSRARELARVGGGLLELRNYERMRRHHREDQLPWATVALTPQTLFPSCSLLLSSLVPHNHIDALAHHCVGAVSQSHERRGQVRVA